MRKLVLCLCALSAVIITVSTGRAASAQDEMTGAQFAAALIKHLGIRDHLPANAGSKDYIMLLEEKGLIFPKDFDPQKAVSAEIKADLLSQILNMKTAEEKNARMEIYRNKAVIEKIEGDVSIKYRGTDKWVPAKHNAKLTEGDYIKTGHGSSAFLRVGIAGRILVKENSRLLLKNLSTEKDKKTENIFIYLAMGEIRVDVRYIYEGSEFETHTPSTVAAVRGTIYTVRVNPEDGKTTITQ